MSHNEQLETENPEMFETSAKATRRKQRKADKEDKQYKRNPKPIEARTARQAEYIKSLTDNELTFGIGPAGVGKTYVPSRIYGAMLAAGEIDKLYVARPNVAKKQHQNGFLPGTLEDKTAPWLVPIFEGIKDSMGPAEFERLKREKKIEEVPYEYIQGRTMKNAAWIVDEAENLDLDDLYITLTRQGDDLRMVLCGDIYQSRINNSGLADVVRMAQSPMMEAIGVVEFTDEDVVRSRQARQWAHAFRNQRYLNTATKCDNQQGVEGLPLFITRGND